MAALPPGFDLCTISAFPAPDGDLFKLGPQPGLGAPLIAIGAIMLTWTTSFIIIRLWVNRQQLRVADYFAFCGYLINSAYAGVLLSMYKWSRHLWNIPACWFDAHYQKLFFAEGILLGPALFFPRAAVLLLYRQLFSVNQNIRKAVYFGLLFIFLISVPWIPLAGYYSTPRPGQTWEELTFLQPQRKLTYYGIVQGVVLILLDIYIFVLPLPIILRLNMTFSKQLQLLAVFATGFFGVVASIVGLVYRVKVLNFDDVSWQQASFSIAFMVENGIIVVISCVPAFSTFLRLYVSQSFLLRSLQSKLHQRESDSSGQDSEARPAIPSFLTFGSPGPRRDSYYELRGIGDIPPGVKVTGPEAHPDISDRPGVVHEINVQAYHSLSNFNSV